MSYSITMQDGSIIDSSLFNVSTPYALSVYTSDFEKADIYEFELNVNYDEYPFITDTKQFKIEIETSCAPNSVSPLSPPSDRTYAIAAAAYETEPFYPFVVTPPWCSITYVTSVDPTPDDPSLILYMGDSERIFSVYGQDISLAGTYTVTVDATD